MADRKITELSAMSAGGQATGDLLTIVDVSEAAAADKNKKMTMENLFKGIPSNVSIGTSSPSDYSSSADDLVIAGSGQKGITIASTNSTQSNIFFADSTSGSGEFAGYLAYIHGSDAFAFGVNGSERMRIDSSGRLLVGTSSATDNTRLDQKLGIVSNSASNGGIRITQNPGTNASVAPILDFRKSRGTTDGSHTIVANGDTLGYITFGGADGVDNESQAAFIFCQVDGTPGANDMPGRLVFSTTADGSTSPTERMRIGQDGNVLIAATSFPTGTSEGFGFQATSKYFYFSRSNAGVANFNRYTSEGDVVSLKYADATVGTISVTASATAYNTSSDYRLKENIVPLTNAVDRVKQITPCRFNFIADPDKTVDGFIAHEAQAIVPECVTGTKDEIDENGDPVYQGIDQSKLVPLLTAALQEAIAKIETLEAKVAALEAG